MQKSKILTPAVLCAIIVLKIVKQQVQKSSNTLQSFKNLYGRRTSRFHKKCIQKLGQDE